MASKRRLRRRSCATKIAHADRAAACAHLSALITATPSANHRSVYKCPFCHKWHVGRTPKKNLRYKDA